MKEKGTLVKGTQAHVEAMSGRMREVDAQECWSMAHVEPDTALQLSFDRSTLVGAVERSGSCIAMFGVAPECLLGSDKGIVWLLATDELADISIAFAKRNRKVIRQMLDFYPVLENHVDVRNRTSLAWLKWCGFTLYGPEPFGPDNMPFYRVELRREDICV
jgi:hypothetical protein